MRTVRWCVTHDRRAVGFVAAVCPNEPSCVVMDLPASYGTPCPDQRQWDGEVICAGCADRPRCDASLNGRGDER